MSERPRLAAVAYPLGRVGSSALMGLLRLAGMNVGRGDRLSGPAPMNPKGFFELPAQEQFLREVYAGIYPHLALPPTPEVLAAVGREFSDAYVALLHRELGDRSPMAIKAPWFLTLPFLHEARDRYDVRLIVLERNLDDQVRSLLRVFRESKDPVRRHASPDLVARYVESWSQFGREVRGLYLFEAIPVSFDELMNDRVSSSRRILEFLGVPPPCDDSIRDWLDPSLVHRASLDLERPPEVETRADAEGRPGPGTSPRLTVVVNTLNEEVHLPDCLESVRGVADEIVVVDMQSDDRTVEIARRYTDRVFFHERTGVVEPARQFAIGKASGDWILVLDADERVTGELARELRRVIAEPGGVDVFLVPRRNFVAGRWLESTGLGPDVELQPRLFRKGSLSWPARVHARPQVFGTEARLPLPPGARIDHLAYRDLRQFVDRLNRYTDHEAQALDEDGATWSPEAAAGDARREIRERYDPARDGTHSLVLSVFMAFYRFLARAKLWERQGYPEKPLPPTARDLEQLFVETLPADAETSPSASPTAETGRVVFGRGFYPEEGDGRWMSGEAVLRVAPLDRPAVLTFVLASGRREHYARLPFHAEIRWNSAGIRTVAFKEGEQETEVRLPLEASQTGHEVRLRSTETFVPFFLGLGNDRRRLSLRLRAVRLTFESPESQRPERPAPEGARRAAARALRLGLIAADSSPVEGRTNDEIPLAFGYFASYLERFGPPVEVVVGLTPEDLAAKGVDLVGISATTEEFEKAKRIASFLKREAGLPVLIGGPHITSLPSNLTQDMDVAVLGEGEETLRELLTLFERRGRRFPPEDLPRVQGIAFREGGRVVRTPERPLLADLDRIPFPDRRRIGVARPVDRAYLFTSRGCRYRCAFCASSRFWGQLRCFSPEYVVREIEHLHGDLGYRSVHFFDDLFIVPRARLEAIAQGMERAGLPGRVTLSGAVRADLVDDRLCETLRRMNVTSVMFGLESFSPRVLDYLKCGTVRPQDNQRALDVLKEHGIDAYVHVIYGSPVETREDLELTLRSLEENLASGKIARAGRGLLRPYPGTPVWDEARARGLVSEDMDWDWFRPYPGTPAWEHAREKGLVSEGRNWERIRCYGGPYMGQIPEEEFHRILLEHEERCMARIPENSGLWIEWGIGWGEVARALLRYAPDRLRSFLDFNVESPDFQTADGWYAPEGEPGHRFRWMGRQSVTYLRRETGERLRVSGRALLDRLGGAVTLSVTVNGRPAGTVPIGSPDFDLDVEIPEGIPEEDLLEVRITADRSFRAPPDVRELSVLVSRIGLAAVPAPTA